MVDVLNTSIMLVTEVTPLLLDLFQNDLILYPTISKGASIGLC